MDRGVQILWGPNIPLHAIKGYKNLHDHDELRSCTSMEVSQHLNPDTIFHAFVAAILLEDGIKIPTEALLCYN